MQAQLQQRRLDLAAAKARREQLQVRMCCSILAAET